MLCWGCPEVHGNRDGLPQDVLGPPPKARLLVTCCALWGVLLEGQILVSCRLLAAQRCSSQSVWKAGHSSGDQSRSSKQRSASVTPRSTAIESQGFLVFWAL